MGSRAQLYTTLLALKANLGNGHPIHYEPLTAAARSVIDPALCPGMGALNEDAERGLQCPFAGCGHWYHQLGGHIRSAHRMPPRHFRRLLGFQESIGLISHALKTKMMATYARVHGDGREFRRQAQRAAQRSPRYVLRPSSPGRWRTVAYANLRDSCRAQLAHRLLDLATTIGRSPSVEDAAAVLGHSYVGRIVTAFGSWNAAKGFTGLDQLRQGRARTGARNWPWPDLLACLQAYHAATGTLPSVRTANSGRGPVVLPSGATILRAFQTKSWAEAMRQAAALLNITGGRYGLPMPQPAEAERA
jgi:hypothetical protein